MFISDSRMWAIVVAAQVSGGFAAVAIAALCTAHDGVALALGAVSAVFGGVATAAIACAPAGEVR